MVIGRKHGKLTAIGEYDVDKWQRRRWLFKCDCGKTFIKIPSAVANGNTRSCGCYTGKFISKKRTIHGRSRSSEYQSWKAIKNRTLNKKALDYERYGGRGITLCKEWEAFENFYRDMGQRPKGKTIGRINNNKGYFKENCRWETIYQQANNRRDRKDSVYLTYMDQRLTVTQWAKKLGILPETMYYRKKHGWTDEMTLNISIRK